MRIDMSEEKERRNEHPSVPPFDTRDTRNMRDAAPLAVPHGDARLLGERCAPYRFDPDGAVRAVVSLGKSVSPVSMGPIVEVEAEEVALGPGVLSGVSGTLGLGGPGAGALEAELFGTADGEAVPEVLDQAGYTHAGPSVPKQALGVEEDFFLPLWAATKTSKKSVVLPMGWGRPALWARRLRQWLSNVPETLFQGVLWLFAWGALAVGVLALVLFARGER